MHTGERFAAPFTAVARRASPHACNMDRDDLSFFELLAVRMGGTGHPVDPDAPDARN